MTGVLPGGDKAGAPGPAADRAMGRAGRAWGFPGCGTRCSHGSSGPQCPPPRPTLTCICEMASSILKRVCRMQEQEDWETVTHCRSHRISSHMHETCSTPKGRQHPPAARCPPRAERQMDLPREPREGGRREPSPAAGKGHPARDFGPELATCPFTEPPGIGGPAAAPSTSRSVQEPSRRGSTLR